MKLRFLLAVALLLMVCVVASADSFTVYLYPVANDNTLWTIYNYTLAQTENDSGIYCQQGDQAERQEYTLAELGSATDVTGHHISARRVRARCQTACVGTDYFKVQVYVSGSWQPTTPKYKFGEFPYWASYYYTIDETWTAQPTHIGLTSYTNDADEWAEADWIRIELDYVDD